MEPTTCGIRCCPWAGGVSRDLNFRAQLVPAWLRVSGDVPLSHATLHRLPQHRVRAGSGCTLFIHSITLTQLIPNHLLTACLERGRCLVFLLWVHPSGKQCLHIRKDRCLCWSVCLSSSCIKLLIAARGRKREQAALARFDAALCPRPGTRYLGVHRRVLPAFAFPEALGFPAFQQLTPKALLGIKPTRDRGGRDPRE